MKSLLSLLEFFFQLFGALLRGEGRRKGWLMTGPLVHGLRYIPLV